MRKPGLLFALILLWATGWAQQYPFVYYTPKDGLVNSRVSRIYQDSKGRLYFMTFGGLSIYDGARFRNFTTQNGLAADMVNDVVEAGEDSFLVATNTVKLNMLVHGMIKTFPSPNQSSPIINHFLKSKDGNIYATADEGLFIIKENRITPLQLNMAPTSLPAYFGSILEFNNYLLLNTNDLRHFRGLYLYDKLKKKIIDSLPQLVVAGFEKDRKGQIWITAGDSVKSVDTAALSTGKLRILPLSPSYQAAAKYPTASFAFEENHAWTIYDGRELIRTGTDGSQVKLIPNKDGRSGIERVFIDRENIVWICSNDYGVFKLVNTTLQFNNLLQVNDQQGIIFFSSYTNDTAWFRDNNKLIRQTGGKTESFLTNIPSQFYWAMQSGPYLYVACPQQLYRSNVPENGTRKLQFQLLHSLSGNNGWRGAGIQDPYGRMIVAEKDTIIVFHDKTVVGQYPTYPEDFIENLSIDRSNRLWVTTRGGGITIFSINPGDRVNYLKPVYRFQKEMMGGSPRSMTFDKTGNAWVGTRSNGLMAFSFENNQLKLLLHLQRRQGLTDDFITSLACDSTNAILVGSQTGLDRITLNNKNEFRIENITKRNNTFGYFLHYLGR